MAHPTALRLAHDDTATDRPPLVLVHGWVSRRSHLAALARALAPSYRVVSVDLPGHGDSPPLGEEEALERLAIPALADAVAGLCDELGLRSAVLVGHSSGGAVVVELAARRPDLAAAVVALDGVILFKPEIEAGTAGLTAALRTPAWREALRGYLEGSYLPTDDPALLRAELDELDRSEQHVVAALPERFGDWDAEAALRAVGAAGTPMLYVDVSDMVRLDRMTELVPQLQVARAAGVGHMQLIGRPDQAVPMVEGFLAATTGRRPVDNRSAVTTLLEALAAGELHRIDELVSSDFVDHGAPPGLVPPGPAGYRAVLGMLRDALQMRWEPLVVVAEGERVMVWVRNSGRHVGDFLGIPATGREFCFDAMHCFRVEGGIIREHWAVRDDLALLRRLGALPG